MINNKALDDVLQKIEHILESDPRTFLNSIDDNGWYYDRIHAAYSTLKETWIKMDNQERLNRMDK